MWHGLFEHFACINFLILTKHHGAKLPHHSTDEETEA